MAGSRPGRGSTRRGSRRATASRARPVAAAAHARRETLLLISENPPNATDIHGVGVNRPAYEASWNLYDRLMTFGVKKDENGVDHDDDTKLEPELAESWDLTPTSVTFKLRRDATLHDDAPVTAMPTTTGSTASSTTG